MIGFLLFAALVIADIVRYCKDDDGFDGAMLFARPVVAFVGALLCGGTFGESVLTAVIWGVLGFVIGAILSENKPATEDTSTSGRTDWSSKDEEEDEGEYEVAYEEEPEDEYEEAYEEEPEDEYEEAYEEEPKEKYEEAYEEEPEKEKAIPLPPERTAAPVYRSDIFEIVGTRLIRCREYHEYIRIPQGVTVIQENAFWNHTHLRGVIFPDTLKTIEKKAFFNCTHLEQLELPEGLETIGNKAFYHCRSLKQVHFPKSLKLTDSGAFANCEELACISFADGCQAEVKLSAFDGRNKLSECTIPGTVRLEESKSFPFFRGKNERMTIRCHAGSSAFFEATRVGATCVLLDGKAYDATGDFVIESGVLKRYSGKNAHVIIPDGVKVIGTEAFARGEHIVHVEMPDSVTTVGERAFSGCYNLRKLRLSNGLQNIQRLAFYGCAFTEMNLPQGMTSIGEQAFCSASVCEVRLTDSLKHIAKGAFTRCLKLRTVHIPASVQLTKDILCDCPQVSIVAEPGSSAAQYATQKGIPLRAPGSTVPTPRVLRSEDLPGNIRRTAYETLDQEDKLVYSAVVQAVMRMEDQFSLAGIRLEKVKWLRLVDAMEADYPELFWVNWGVLRYFTYQEGSLSRVYAVTKEQRDRMQQQIDAFVKPFLASVPSHLGDYEKAKRAYEWVAAKIEYDHAGLKEQNENRYSSVTGDDLRNIYGAFVKKKVVCVGYALAFTYLLRAMGIECVMRTGGTWPNNLHAWACAKLEGDFYHIDVTWGDGFILGYEYFGLTDDEMYMLQEGMDFLATHISCDATHCSFFVKEGLYVQSVDEKDLLRRIRRYASATGAKQVPIKLPNKILLAEAEACLEGNANLKALSKELGHILAYTTTNAKHNTLNIHF